MKKFFNSIARIIPILFSIVVMNSPTLSYAKKGSLAIQKNEVKPGQDAGNKDLNIKSDKRTADFDAMLTSGIMEENAKRPKKGSLTLMPSIEAVQKADLERAKKNKSKHLYEFMVKGHPNRNPNGLGNTVEAIPLVDGTSRMNEKSRKLVEKMVAKARKK